MQQRKFIVQYALIDTNMYLKGEAKLKNTQYNMKLKSFTQMHILLNFQNCALYYCVTNERDTAICFLSTNML